MKGKIWFALLLFLVTAMAGAVTYDVCPTLPGSFATDMSCSGSVRETTTGSYFYGTITDVVDNSTLTVIYGPPSYSYPMHTYYGYLQFKDGGSGGSTKFSLLGVAENYGGWRDYLYLQDSGGNVVCSVYEYGASGGTTTMVDTPSGTNVTMTVGSTTQTCILGTRLIPSSDYVTFIPYGSFWKEYIGDITETVPDALGVVFSDGFESGGYGAWTTYGGSPSGQEIIVASPTHTGLYASRLFNAGTGVRYGDLVKGYPYGGGSNINLTGYTSANLSFWFYPVNCAGIPVEEEINVFYPGWYATNCGQLKIFPQGAWSQCTLTWGLAYMNSNFWLYLRGFDGATSSCKVYVDDITLTGITAASTTSTLSVAETGLFSKYEPHTISASYDTA